MSIRRRLLRDPVLPPMYQRVEYLESTGTQYILTNITDPYGYRVHLETTEESFPENVGYLGWFTTNSWNNVQSYNPAPRSIVITRVKNTVYRIGYPFNSEIVVDGLDVSASGYTFDATSIPPNENIKFALFGYNRVNGIVNCGKCRIRYAKFWSSDHEPIGDYIPCIRIPDGKPGMYDTVTKSFFVNQGTGEFVVP